ncbi:MAG: hypothetical protein EAZ14_10825 [Runella slithyformis]|nr:MAG: hypothetical protein EAY79_06945 [Runella slithyformis]TAF80674.1 MAG: hypothetical protein EAZ50_08220 [Runella slithyformis]TAH07753.1 MAG: hypothetical protein EAZ14_10825 [Runella slithyformis]
MKRTLLIIVVLAVASVGVLYSLPKIVVNTKTGQLSESKEASSSSSDTTSKVAPAAHSTALTQSQQNEVKRLMNIYQTASSQASKVKSATELSVWYAKEKRFDSAAKYAETVAVLDPTLPNIMAAGDRYYDAYGFATNEKQSNELGEKTRKWYQKALDKNPNLVSAKANLAMTYVSTPNPMQGIMLLREILEADPTNELALFNLGMLSMRSNQYQKAADRFAQILKVNPSNTKVRFYLGVSLAQLGKKKEALEALELVKKTEQDPTIQAAIKELEQELK